VTAHRAVEARRDIVEVRDVNGETALCPAEAILLEVDGENQWLLYPAALLDEGGYVLNIDGENRVVLLRRAESQAPPAMVILSDFDPSAP
jgi:hypothetical protein